MEISSEAKEVLRFFELTYTDVHQAVSAHVRRFREHTEATCRGAPVPKHGHNPTKNLWVMWQRYADYQDDERLIDEELSEWSSRYETLYNRYESEDFSGDLDPHFQDLEQIKRSIYTKLWELWNQQLEHDSQSFDAPLD